ncbi:hypothetical protein JTB14_027246 [Gonioctena quinquepunctata]|nr:hypothetical protein JTB14_027246 [Gonioctena quinquepunctata]
MTYNNEKQTHNLVVDGEMPLKHEEKLNRKHLFKIKEARHYLGGVPPTSNRTCVAINNTSLLGFVGQTSQKEELTNETISYGVIKTSRDPNKKELYESSWYNY